MTSKVVLFRLPLRPRPVRPSFPFNVNPWCPNVIITCYATTRWESSSSSRDRTQIATIVICPPADEMLVWRSVKLLPALNDQTRNESADSAAARDLMPARQRMPVSMLFLQQIRKYALSSKSTKPLIVSLRGPFLPVLLLVPNMDRRRTDRTEHESFHVP